MTIDEAIEKYKEITTDANCPGHCNISCEKCVQESKKIVEWMEELKMYRQLAPREFEKGFDCGYKTGYYKTIDKCLEIVKFHKDIWDGIEWAIKDIEDLKEREID